MIITNPGNYSVFPSPFANPSPDNLSAPPIFTSVSSLKFDKIPPATVSHSPEIFSKLLSSGSLLLKMSNVGFRVLYPGLVLLDGLQTSFLILLYFMHDIS